MNIIEMAREAGFERVIDVNPHTGIRTVETYAPDSLKRFATLVRNDALEEAAEYLESVHRTRLVKFADAIRALKEQT